MNRHLSEEILLRFVAGDLDESRAVEAALHIDECPLCAARAAEAEPLAFAFASMPDPALPDGFEQAVLAAVEQPAPVAVGLEVPWLGIGLISTAALLMVVAGAPTALLWDFAALVRGLAVASTILLEHLPSPAVFLTLAAAAAFGCSLTAFRLLGLSRESA